MPSITIRTLAEVDWEVYKALRLRALLESPDSFGSSHEREVQFPDAEWMGRLSQVGRSKQALPLVAKVDDHPSGLAWGIVHEEKPNVVHVYQMWVAPTARGLGVARALLDAIASWAMASGLECIQLDVFTANSAAVALYRSFGFEPCGKLQELKADTGSQESASIVQPMIYRFASPHNR